MVQSTQASIQKLILYSVNCSYENKPPEDKPPGSSIQISFIHYATCILTILQNTRDFNQL